MGAFEASGLKGTRQDQKSIKLEELKKRIDENKRVLMKDNAVFIERCAEDYYRNTVETEVKLKLSQGTYGSLTDLKQDIVLYRQRFDPGRRSQGQ